MPAPDRIPCFTLKPVPRPAAGGERAQQNAKAAQLVNDAIVAAVPGTTNLPAAVGAMLADPVVAKAAAIEVMASPSVAALVEVGGGIVEARKANIAIMESPAWWKGLLTPAFFVSLILLAGAGAIIADVLYAHPANWTASDRSQALIVAISIISAVMGFYLGSSIGSARKDEIIAGAGR